MDFNRLLFGYDRGFDGRGGGWDEGDFRGGWAPVSGAALARLEAAKAKWDINKDKQPFLLHPNKDHLVEDTWKKFKKHVENAGHFVARIKLNDEQKKSYRVTRKAAYLVCVGKTKDTALAACKAALAADADPGVPAAPAQVPAAPAQVPAAPAPVPARDPAPVARPQVVTPATHGKQKPVKSASKSASKKT